MRNKKIIESLYQQHAELAQISKTVAIHYPTALKKTSNIRNLPKSHFNNCLAIQILEETGNNSPNREAIAIVESILKVLKKISKAN